jgi:proteasome lid subunit RPN8/RPN11
MVAFEKHPPARLCSSATWILIAAAGVGLAALCYYFSRGLTTAHYDAKAHLVVARRIVDAEVPGYSQMGAHWLPLIHLVYIPFVLIESQYRSGLLPSLISVAAFAVAVCLVFRISRGVTDSPAAGAFAAVLMMANPNLQYVQSCPLAEPLYMMLSLFFLAALLRWREKAAAGLPWEAAIWGALAALCRYEGWLALAGSILLILHDGLRRRLSRPHAFRAAALIALVSGVPILAHFAYIYARLGDSIFQRVARGYSAPEVTYGNPLLALIYHFGEIAQVATVLPLIAGLAGTLLFIIQKDGRERRAPLLLLWVPSLVNIAALQWGLIYRVRYSVLLLPALAIFASLLAVSARASRGALLGGALTVTVLPWLSWIFPHRWEFHFLYPGPGLLVLPVAAMFLALWGMASCRHFFSLALLCICGLQLPVLEGETRAVLAEAREHDFMEAERRDALLYLRENYDGTGILLDMSRLAPLVFDSGLPVKEFVYNEGDMSAWRRAAASPERVVGWICSEPGDAISNRLQIDPHWARRYALAVRTKTILLLRLAPEDRPALRPAKQP